MPETFPGGHNPNITPEQIDAMIGQRSALKRAPRLHEVANAALFLACDRASGLAGTVINVTVGLVSER